MILHGMQSAYGEHDELALRMFGATGKKRFRMYGSSQAAEHDFGRVDARIMFQKVPAIELRDGQAEFAVG